MVVNKITDIIPNKLIGLSVDVLEFLSLADPNFNTPGRIDILLGSEIFYELLNLDSSMLWIHNCCRKI